MSPGPALGPLFDQGGFRCWLVTQGKNWNQFFSVSTGIALDSGRESWLQSGTNPFTSLEQTTTHCTLGAGRRVIVFNMHQCALCHFLKNNARKESTLSTLFVPSMALENCDVYID